MDKIKIIECPRDAMQGIKKWIPTKDKIGYLQNLLKVGFDTLDCGSFVSSKVIPQLKDTGEVIRNLDLTSTKTKLLVIIANLRGAEIACNYDQIDYLGFPFSISENFQIRNVNKTIKLGICGEHGGDPKSIDFCNTIGLDYVSCSPYRIPIAKLAAAQARLKATSD